MNNIIIITGVAGFIGYSLADKRDYVIPATGASM